MPSFNILKAFNPKSRSDRVMAKDYAYPVSAPDPVPILSSTTTHSRAVSSPPEIVRSQPLTDPSLGRRGTLRKKHRHHHSDGSAHSAQRMESQYATESDIIPGPLPIGSGNPSMDASIYPDEYPYSYEDLHHQRMQYVDPRTPNSTSTHEQYEAMPEMYAEPPYHDHNGRHHRSHQSPHQHRHQHHNHHHHNPSQHEYDRDVEYTQPPVATTHNRGPHYDIRAHDQSFNTSRSHTPIPSVFREPDSFELQDADPIVEHQNGQGVNMADDRGSRHGNHHHSRPRHGSATSHLPKGRIGWIPNEKLRESADDPEAVPVVNEPTLIPGPVDSENPLRTNVYHTREPGYDPNRRRTRGSSTGHEQPRLKTYMYKDHHYSETIEPRMHEQRSHHTESDPEPEEEYRYIVPSGVAVIFRDHDGNEITRIGYPGYNSAADRRPRHMAPFVVQDEFGRVLYRHEGSESSRGHRHGQAPARVTKVIVIDENGNQIPLKTKGSHSSRSHHSHSHSHSSRPRHSTERRHHH